jgi:hypothetical protein
MPGSFPEWMDLFSNMAIAIGAPFALATFVWQERKERLNEEEEIYDKLMEQYTEVQTKLFEHPELDQHDTPLINTEDSRRQRILYDMLVALFERAFILLYGEKNPSYKRLWNSWNDYISLWAARPNFLRALPELMKGEDPEFVAFMARVTGLALKS